MKSEEFALGFASAPALWRGAMNLAHPMVFTARASRPRHDVAARRWGKLAVVRNIMTSPADLCTKRTHMGGDASPNQRDHVNGKNGAARHDIAEHGVLLAARPGPIVALACFLSKWAVSCPKQFSTGTPHVSILRNGGKVGLDCLVSCFQLPAIVLTRVLYVAPPPHV